MPPRAVLLELQWLIERAAAVQLSENQCLRLAGLTVLAPHLRRQAALALHRQGSWPALDALWQLARVDEFATHCLEHAVASGTTRSYGSRCRSPRFWALELEFDDKSQTFVNQLVLRFGQHCQGLVQRGNKLLRLSVLVRPLPSFTAPVLILDELESLAGEKARHELAQFVHFFGQSHVQARFWCNGWLVDQQLRDQQPALAPRLSDAWLKWAAAEIRARRQSHAS